MASAKPLCSLLLLAGCLTNEDLYDQRRALLTDQDGDGITEEQGDCDDKDANRFPGAPELCDGEDDDCDTVIDEEGVGTFWYTDIDGDTFGDPLSEVESCQSPGDSYVQDKADCNDRDPAVHPGVAETCDGVDEDCNGAIDDNPSDPTTWHLDQDDDGYGSPDETTQACTAPTPAWLADGSDCDDTNPNVFPDAPELCDSLDNDCDGTTDDPPLTGPNTYYPDVDGDGVGDSASTVAACTPTEGYVEVPGDCDDTDPDVFPGHAEDCNDGKNNDCSTTETVCVWPASIDMTDHVVISAKTALEMVGQQGDAADIDGDGDLDLVVAVPGAYNSSSGQRPGQLSIFRSPVTTSTDYSAAPQFLTGPSDDSGFGYGMAIEDINADGYEDLIIGSEGQDQGSKTWAGQVNIVYGPENASGSINSLTNVTLKGTATKMFLGTEAYTVGDTDGNGKTDFIVGSHFQSVSPLTVSGGHYLFTSPPSVVSGDVTTLADATFSGRGSYEYFGLSYSGGDVNGDGLDDILTGTDAGSVVGGGYGEAYLFYGPISGAHTGLTADVLMTGEYPGGVTAITSSIIGDANGDGYEDLVVDAPQAGYGAAYFVFGSPSLIDMGLQDAGLKIRGDDSERKFAQNVSRLNDLNQDGEIDVAFSCYVSNDEDATEVLLFWGPFTPSGSTLQAFADADVVLEDENYNTGQEAMKNVGDLNGDTVNDLFVGGSWYGGSDSTTGFYGVGYLISGVGI